MPRTRVAAALVALLALMPAAPGPIHADGTSPLLDGAPVGAPAAPAVAYVGDSITALNLGTLERLLQLHQVPAWRVAAQSGRRTTERLEFGSSRIHSGLDAIGALHAAGVDPAVWVVALGTNDLGAISRCGCADRTAFIHARLRLLADAIGPGRRIVWVNVRHQGMPASTVQFNEALRSFTAGSTTMTVVDWYSLSAGRTGWLPDGIHPTPEAAAWLFNATAAEVARQLFLAAPGATPTPPGPPVPSLTAAAAQAGAVAVRLRPPAGPTTRDLCGDLGPVTTFASIQPGATGARVVALQCALRRYGLDPGTQPGVFGAATTTAVLQFQRFQGLYQGGSGVVGAATAHALGLTAA